MSKKLVTYLMLPLLFLFCNSSQSSVAGSEQKGPDAQTGTLEKMIVADGSVAMDVDLNRLNGISSATGKPETLRFAVAHNSFFTVLVFNNVLRGALQGGAIALIPQNSATLPAALSASLKQLVVEKLPSSDAFDLAVGDGKTGFVFFNVDRHQYDYDAGSQSLNVNGGRLLISTQFAEALGRPSEAGSVVGEISIATSMQPVEVQTLVNGTVRSAVMPPLQAAQPSIGSVPGPDVIVGDLPSVEQAPGSNGSFVGLGVGTTSCNNGKEPLHWLGLPNERSSGHSTEPVSNERRNQQQRPVRANWPILAETCIFCVRRQRLQFWLQHHWLHYRLQSMLWMLRSVLGELKL